MSSEFIATLEENLSRTRGKKQKGIRRFNKLLKKKKRSGKLRKDNLSKLSG